MRKTDKIKEQILGLPDSVDVKMKVSQVKEFITGLEEIYDLIDECHASLDARGVPGDPGTGLDGVLNRIKSIDLFTKT